MQDEFDVIVVGGGISGLWATLDLTLRGLRVLLIERKVLGGETSGKFHGLLHSGARYVVTDPPAARECAEENKILSQIAPHAIEDTGGFFVAVTRSDEEYYEDFISGLKRTGITFKEWDPREAVKEEPNLTSEARLVVEVPDKVVYSRDLVASIALTAFKNGALILEGLEAKGLEIRDSNNAIYTVDRLTGREYTFKAKAIVNATGPWAAEFARKAGVEVEVLPTAGTMVVYSRRLTRRVINRMRPPSEGDILVPYSNTSIMGTTAFLIDDVESASPEPEDIDFLTKEGSLMVPALAKTPVLRAYTSVRPLIRIPGGPVTRDFMVVKHNEVEGLFTVIGGKFTTGRLMGEKVGDTVSEYLGLKRKSLTRITKLDGEDPYSEIDELARGAGSKLGLAINYLAMLRGGIDEDRGRPGVYMLLQALVSLHSRSKLGLVG
ncbi:MAG: FAD-dependent oxidoreductase [Desulfurococcales archaeon]|nr:FAD-dependent oxidoreductase [Desulfurococcales archaeon]